MKRLVLLEWREISRDLRSWLVALLPVFAVASMAAARALRRRLGDEERRGDRKQEERERGGAARECVLRSVHRGAGLGVRPGRLPADEEGR